MSGLESENLGMQQPPHDHEDPFMREEAEAMEEIAKHANYGNGGTEGGNWSNLLYQRLKNPETKRKFLDFKAKYPTLEHRTSEHFKEKNSEGISLDRQSDLPIDEYKNTIANYDENLEKVFASTRYHYARGVNFDGSEVDDVGLHTKQNGGASAGYGDEGSVFIDAERKNGNEYNDFDKEIIEAHEKAHGIFGNLTKGERDHIRMIFDNAKIGYPYRKSPEEILMRMTQLKNYFGFKGNEQMSLNALHYAMAHYVKDVGLDNNMSDFFNAITPENEQRVVDLMNEYPC